MKSIEQFSSKQKNPVKQRSICYDKNCQDTKFMQPVKPKMDIQSIPRRAKLQSKCNKRDQVKLNEVSMNDNNNCQSPKFIKYVCSDKTCQVDQCVNMWPMKLEMDMWLPKPAIPYKYTRLCNDKNCQAIRCYRNSGYTKCVKNHQFTRSFKKSVQ